MSSGRRPRVLYVDDNRDTADSAADFLRHFGVEVVVCYDGASARTTGHAFSPDVCMIDLNMPGMDGDELLTALRDEAPPSKRILYVAVTATGNEAARTRTTAAGFHLHFVKPVALHALLQVVETWDNVIRSKPSPVQAGSPGEKAALPTDPMSNTEPPHRTFADRRSSVRRDVTPVRVLLASSAFRNRFSEGYVLDRSTGGLRIAAADGLAPGMVVEVQAADAPEGVGFVSLRVRRCTRGDDTYTLGCEFEPTPPWNVLQLFG